MCLTLYGRCKTGVTLDAAIMDWQAVPHTQAVALLATPHTWYIAAVEHGKYTVSSQHKPFDPLQVYEARIFTKDSELRWTNDNGGYAVAIAEENTYLPADWACCQMSARLVETIAHRYLLWGQGTGEDPLPGWSRLAESRIGSLDIPYTNITEKQYAQLTTCEYLAVVDDYGNVAAVEERLIELGAYDGRGA
ncbi:MAG TPA: CRISPR-associated protein Csx19 [Armatimonadota bacterium]|jgi:CRISPR-associated protein (TIGR03984 family)